MTFNIGIKIMTALIIWKFSFHEFPVSRRIVSYITFTACQKFNLISFWFYYKVIILNIEYISALIFKYEIPYCLHCIRSNGTAQWRSDGYSHKCTYSILCKKRLPEVSYLIFMMIGLQRELNFSQFTRYNDNNNLLKTF